MNTPHLLISDAAGKSLHQPLNRLVQDGRLKITTLPKDGEPPLSATQIEALTCAFFSRDLHLQPSPGGAESTRTFFRIVEQASQMKWLQIFFAGVSSLTVLDRLQARGVAVSTATGAAAEPIAHSIVAAVLGLARGLLHHIDAQRRHAWEPLRDAQVPRPLAGQRATVVGMGPIGRETARLLGSFGLRVCGVRQSAEPVEYCETVIPYSQLKCVLPETDWLIMACPLTETTRQLIDAAALALLPAQAHFINIARGEVVDEPALIDALAAGRLAGAYLDVFTQEPLGAESPLWQLKNVLISAHTAGARSDYEDKVAEIFVDNLQRFVDGRPLTRLAIRAKA